MNFKRVLLVLIGLIYSYIINAQPPQLEWIKQFGGNNTEEIVSFTIDQDGNIYTTGYFSDTTDLDPGPDQFLLASGSRPDLFIQKLDKNGNLLWGKHMSSAEYVTPRKIALNNEGDLILTTRIAGTADCDPSNRVLNITTNGNDDIIIQKMDTTGVLKWTKQIGGTGSDFINDFTIDANDNIYIVGNVYGRVDLNPGPDSLYLNSIGSTLNGFFLKLNTNGELQWARSMGKRCSLITFDPSGYLWVVGAFSDTTDIDPGPATTLLIPAYSLTAQLPFFSKFDTNGVMQWGKHLDGQSSFSITSVSFDNNGDAILTGNFGDLVELDPSTGQLFLGATGRSTDVFIEKLTPNGDLIWVKHLGGPGSDHVSGALMKDDNNYLFFGSFSDSIDFDPSPSIAKYVSSGQRSGYLLSLDTTGRFLWASMDLPSSYQRYDISQDDDQGNIYVAGYFRDTLTLAPSIGIATFTTNFRSDAVMLKFSADTLTSRSLDQKFACNSYTWTNGVTYTSSNNTAKDTVTNSVGNDSIVSLLLTINYDINKVSNLSACEAIEWDSILYRSDTTLIYITPALLTGCDSIHTIKININYVSLPDVIDQNDTLIAASGYTSYQWFNEYGIIVDATDTQFSPTESGHYYYQATDQFCTGVSDTVEVIITSISDLDLEQVTIWPNPAQSSIFINLPNSSNLSDIDLLDLSGRIINSFSGNTSQIDVSMIENGIYFLKLTKNNKSNTIKVIVRH